MVTKLNVSKDHLKEFSISKVVDFEGCPTALKYLQQKFGDRVESLADCRNEVEELILKDGKAEWVINFMLNLLTPKNRAKFFHETMAYSLTLINDQEISKDILDAIEYYSRYHNQNTLSKIIAKLEKHLIPINSELEYYKTLDAPAPAEEVIASLHHERLMLESALTFMNDKERNFTRSITRGLLKIAESKSCLDIVEYKYEITIQSMAMDLLEFTELWPKK